MRLRRAQAKDANAAALLILSSAANTLSRMFDVCDKHHALGFIEQAFTLADGQFGHANHWVIEVDGQVVAIATSWHNELSDNFHHATVHSIASYYGLIDSLDVIQRCQLLKDIIPPPKKDECCVGHFVVALLHRRKGLGRKLLAHMQAIAVRNGKKIISLDVELRNQGAINFYLASGFTFAQKPTSRQANVADLAAHGHMFLTL
jgi:GNAT superfamily N-acetyltransferase